uniref:adenine phosphoribosyltransferase n=1 Tax=Eptatretus burgeri TaxID=7764 RepID=A0A8C4N785_EPTBU
MGRGGGSLDTVAMRVRRVLLTRAMDLRIVRKAMGMGDITCTCRGPGDAFIQHLFMLAFNSHRNGTPLPAACLQFLHPQALSDCIEDLCEPFLGEAIDIVTGIDAMGFILGAAAAAYLRKGFLAVRKSGHLCVNTSSEPYTDYTGKQKSLEVRTDVVKKGTRLLIVDQWIETGGTMQAAIRLMEKLGGIVIGVAAICIEESDGGKTIIQKYKTSSCIPKSLQPKFNEHCLASFHNTLDNTLLPMKANV